jgi:cellulose biosynthesis protein BcsQ
MATIRSDGKLADAVLALVDQLGRERRLAVALRTLEEDYELVVVDAAPQLSLVSINVLNAVGELLVPVDAGAFSVAGLGRLQESVDQVRRYLDNHALVCPAIDAPLEVRVAEPRDALAHRNLH